MDGPIKSPTSGLGTPDHDSVVHAPVVEKLQGSAQRDTLPPSLELLSAACAACNTNRSTRTMETGFGW